MTTTEIITYALAGLGALVSAASIASTLVPPESTLGLWLAWFASMPIRHVPRKPKGETVAKATTALLVLLLASGCTATARNQLARDATETACAVKLTDSPEIQTIAKEKGVPVQELAALICAVLVKDGTPQ